MANHYLGIDISKEKVDVCLLRGDSHVYGEFTNNKKGFKSLLKWLRKNEAEQPHICMEATGYYWEDIAACLYDEGYRISVVNPMAIKAFGKSEMRRTKTDKVDAGIIARFCRANNPRLWEPPTPQRLELRDMVRTLEGFKTMQNQEKNRLSRTNLSTKAKEVHKKVLRSIEKQIHELQEAIEEHVKSYPDLKEKWDLLLSIKGIGPGTAAIILSETEEVEVYESARQMAAHAGLTPKRHESGSSVRGRSKMSKMGNARLRRAFYMPAMVAARWNPIVKAFYERLIKAGKTEMVALGACMRKLLHIAYGVLKNKEVFDPDYLTAKAGISR